MKILTHSHYSPRLDALSHIYFNLSDGLAEE